MVRLGRIGDDIPFDNFQKDLEANGSITVKTISIEVWGADPNGYKIEYSKASEQKSKYSFWELTTSIS